MAILQIVGCRKYAGSRQLAGSANSLTKITGSDLEKLRRIDAGCLIALYGQLERGVGIGRNEDRLFTQQKKIAQVDGLDERAEVRNGLEMKRTILHGNHGSMV